MIQWIWSPVPLPFLYPACTSETSQFTNRWSLAWRILSITLLTGKISTIDCQFEHSLALPFFEIGMKTDFFQSYGHCWVFHIRWHIKCRTLTASPFMILNSSPPLALFVVMLLKAHLTSHSRLSGSRWIEPRYLMFDIMVISTWFTAWFIALLSYASPFTTRRLWSIMGIYRLGANKSKSQDAEKIGIKEILCLLWSGPIKCFPWWNICLLFHRSVGKNANHTLLGLFLLSIELKWICRDNSRESTLGLKRRWELGFIKGDDGENIWRSPNSANKPFCAKVQISSFGFIDAPVMPCWANTTNNLSPGSLEYTWSPLITHR